MFNKYFLYFLGFAYWKLAAVVALASVGMRLALDRYTACWTTLNSTNDCSWRNLEKITQFK